MTCPRCGFTNLRPARDYGDGRRRYRCYQCGHEFETVEMLTEEYDRLKFRADCFRAIINGNGRKQEAA